MPRTQVDWIPDSRPGCEGSLTSITREYHSEHFLSASGFYADSERLLFRTNGGVCALLQHTAYFCPTCGEIWFRRIITPHESYDRGPVEWTVRPLPCAAHGGGLIIFLEELEGLSRFPLPVLAHDAELLLSRSPVCK